MKRTILSLLIVLLAAIPLLADSQPAITYDLAADTFADMLELLDQAIYLATNAVLADTKSEIKTYVQGILNLLTGPDSDLYDSENEIMTDAGLQPLLAGLYEPYTGAIPYDALFPDSSSWDSKHNGFRYAWWQAETTMAKAQSVAEGLMSAPYTYPWEEEVYTLFALLVAVRGGDEDVFPLGGVGALSYMFPTRETEVGIRESIQEAIDRAPAGGIVYIDPGVYREAITIDKSISLIARPMTDGASSELGSVVIDGALWGCAITVDSASPITVSIKGFEVRGNLCGISVRHEATANLANILFVENDTGLLAHEGSFVAEQCTFTANRTAISLGSAGQGTLRGCVIEESTSWYGAIDFSCSQLTIDHCEIRDNIGVGIRLGPAPGTELHLVDSRIVRNDIGIEAQAGWCSPVPLTEPVDYDDYDSGLGTATGWNNVIPGPGEPDANSLAAFDATALDDELDLAFLTEPRPEDE